MENNWIYFGVFLDDESINKLLKFSQEICDKNWKKFCHHMTIAFNDKSETSRAFYDNFKQLFGTEIDITATHIGMSDDAIAVKVDFPLPTANNLPHITLATPQDGKPVNSNYIKDWKVLEEPINLHGTIAEYTRH